MTNAKHVVIIGGGLAGLSAAWVLQQRGVSYTVLEASSRLGGMVVTNTGAAYRAPDASPNELRVVAKVTYTWRP